MALKDLLVCVDQFPCAQLRLRLAADLASRHRCRLTALFIEGLSETQTCAVRAAELGLASFSQVERLNREIRASIDQEAQKLRSALEQFGEEHGLPVEWRCIDGSASILVPQHARYADLCILGHDNEVAIRSADYSFSEQMLFTTGRPVLLVPAEATLETLGRRLLVAWNSSRPAARAVNDALPLIERAEHSTVFIVNAHGLPMPPPGAPPLEEMLEHLRRHGASADVVRLENVAPRSVAHLIEEQSRAVGADLIVAGAFGHPQLWEKMLGGVTRDLLARMKTPVFMSH